MLPFDRFNPNSAVVADAPRSRRLTRLVATSAVALLASASGCGDDTARTSSSSDGGAGPTTTTTTGSPTSGSTGQGGDGASGQGGETGSSTTSTSSSSQGGSGQGGDTTSGGGQGGTGQGGTGQGGTGQGGDTTSGGGQGGTGQGGTGQGGTGQGGTGQGGAGQGGAGQGGAGQGGAGQGGAGQGGTGQNSAGQGGAPPQCVMDADCADSVGCTTDTCLAGVCQNVADDTFCDNDTFCDGVELCEPSVGDAVTGCTASSGPPCDDDVGCTSDVCDEAADSCVNTGDDGLCDNGIACDGLETCDEALDCQAGQPESCDDGLSCTIDLCSGVTGQCEHIPSSAVCDNGLFCDGVEQCDPNAAGPGTGCLDGPDPVCNDGFSCTSDSCNEATDSCAFAPNHAACGDGNVCDGIESCDPANGAPGTGCAEGNALNCSDGIPCTQNTCDPVAGCVYIENDAACDDGSDCNGFDQCDAQAGGCVDGAPVVCADDGIDCTVESCDEQTLGCNSVADSSLCPLPGQFCNVTLGCVFGEACDDDADCGDGDLCNGAETCSDAGICQAGTTVTCDDGIGCTFDSCNPGTGQCEVFTDDDACSDGDACNGLETCEADVGCQAGAPVVCNDAFSCTANQCDSATGQCQFIPDNSVCNDGDPCNGAEQCTGAANATGCSTGAPLVCPGDGIACTAEACVPGVGCQSAPNDDLCPCGQTCGAQGCGNFCIPGTCQGKTYQCGDCLDNDGDCRIDSGDSQCLGTCDNTEDSFFGGIPGQNNSPCKSDCYFDQDTGSGNDECYWSHKCDPLSVAPNYPPEGSQCAYNPNTSIPGYGGSCAEAFDTQSAQCGEYCGPLTPNGCDCFGCCDIPGAPTSVWLGSTVDGAGSCDIDSLDDPSRCKPCTQVAACLNDCDTCEICIGKPELPPECGGEQQCPVGDQACGQPGQALCPSGQYCVTGCCQPVAD